MSQNTDENRDIYADYLTRSMPSVSAAKTVPEVSVGLDSHVDEYTTESLSVELNSAQTELVNQYMSLTLVSNLIEDTMIIVDKDGNETPESFQRRKDVLTRLKAAITDYKSLRDKILQACPELEEDLKKALGREHQAFAAGRSNLIKLFGTVNSKHVTHDPGHYHYEFKKEDKTPRKLNVSADRDIDPDGEQEDTKVVQPPKTIDEKEIKTDKDMLDFISGMLDTPIFINATLVEKRFIKDKIREFKERTSVKGVDPTVISSVDEYSKDTLGTLDALETYVKFIKPKNVAEREER